MNKYLEKIAAKRAVYDKTELEPGVFWNHQLKQVQPSTTAMKEEMDRKDRHSRLASGGVIGMYGAIGGGFLGARYGRNNERFNPAEEYDEAAHSAAIKRLDSMRPRLNDYSDIEKWRNDAAKHNRDRLNLILDSKGFTTKPPPKSPRLAALLNKVGGPAKALGAVGALAGFGLVGSLGYMAGGLKLPTDKAAARDSYLSNLENKHKKTIDKIEGWD